MVLPKNFGKYDVVGVLGAGAMGTVYDAVDPVIGRRVAIKTVLKHSLDASEAQGLLDRFKQEAQAAGRLNHPGVCSIYDYGETDYVSFIAMEYISGKELKAYFDESHKFDLKEVVRIMTEILDALDHAHRNKVVHRDIKPANIMITDNGRVKVADFGVAKIESSMLTQVGTKVGTPAYMSPEQHKGLSADGRSDLFSCGVILYQFLTGTRPFTGGSHTVAQEILTRSPTPPSEINTSLTPAWDTIIKMALAKRRDERYLTARDFIDALTKGLNDTPGGIGVPFQTTAKAPSETTNASERSATGTNADRSDRTNVAMMESELEFWKEIKDSDIEEDFAAFVDSFPVGRFSHIAKRRLDKLRTASARSQAGGDLPMPAPAVSVPAVPVLAPSAPAQARGEADEDRTLLSNHNREVVAEGGKPQPIAAGESANGATPASPEADVDATMIRSRTAAVKAPEAKAGAADDADATLLQRAGEAGVGTLDTDDEIFDLGGSDDIDLDLSEEIRTLPPESLTRLDAPSAAPVVPPGQVASPAPALSPAPLAAKEEAGPAKPPDGKPALAAIPATSKISADVAPAPQPPVSPVNSLAPSATPVKPAVDVPSPAPAASKEASPAKPPPSPPPLAAPAAKYQSGPAPVTATVAAATVPLKPQAQVPQTEDLHPVPQAKKSPVPVLAGVALALAAAGAGWFMLGSTPTPSSNPAETAGHEPPAKKAPGNAENQLPSAALEKSAPAPSKETDNAKKANDTAEQKKTESDAKKLADEKTTAKTAAGAVSPDKSAADKLAKAAADKATADKAGAEKSAAGKLAADKASADKLAADKLAADKLAADKLAADKLAADKLAADKLAADKLAADKAAADKLASEKVAAVSTGGSIADRIAAASAPAELYKRAVALRNEGKATQAVALLRQASSQGHGPSSRLLAVIFTDGSGDVRANFREVERYKALAETQGER